MQGGLNTILPEPISAENEKVILEMVKRKIKNASEVGVRLLHAMEERFGPEAREVMREMVRNPRPAPRTDPGDPRADLKEFIADLDEACVGSHHWEKVAEEPDRVAYWFSQCTWAEVYRELGEPELGYAFCATDGPAVSAHNPRLGFTRTKVQMNGDPGCNHVFYVEDSQ